MKKLVHLECGHAMEVSKPEAKQIKVEGIKTLACEDCNGMPQRILSLRVPKLAEPKPEPRNTRGYGRGRSRT